MVTRSATSATSAETDCCDSEASRPLHNNRVWAAQPLAIRECLTA